MQNSSDKIENITKHFLPYKGEDVQFVVRRRLKNGDLILTTITVQCDSGDYFVSDAIGVCLDGLMKNGS